MIELLEKAEFWHWWVLAALLIGIEMFAPSTILLWPGIGAAVVGVVLLAWSGMAWEYQILVFAGASVVSVAGWRAYARTRPPVVEQRLLNRRAQRYVGRVFTLQEPIVNGQGKVKVDDTIWKITGEDLAAGGKVRVTAVDGVILRVEPA